ncbi:MAG: structural protein [Gammaproteobacteria bacterium]|nr:structural protein [Gammaproteobacteria bacterium]
MALGAGALALLAAWRARRTPSPSAPAFTPSLAVDSPADSWLDEVTVTVKKMAGVAMPRGLRNCNPGNIRWSAANNWKGQTGQDAGGYAIFEGIPGISAPWGVRAMGRVLGNYVARGDVTVRRIIARWAPAGDGNDTGAYVAAVSRRLALAPDVPIPWPARRLDLVRAIIWHECGVCPFTDGQLAEWLALP